MIPLQYLFLEWRGISAQKLTIDSEHFWRIFIIVNSRFTGGKMENIQKSDSFISRLILTKVIPAIIVMLIVIFLPAGTFNYWEGWAYFFSLMIPMVFVFNYLIKNDRGLLERRMKFREKEKEQSLIVTLSYPVILLAFILPGLDHRFGWSHVPPIVVILALFCFLVGYGLFFMVLRQNSYASRVIEVAEDQKVISTGMYGIVRHPMYMSTLIIYLFSPLALGSYWAVIPALFIIPVLAARIMNEEKVLRNNLPGYEEYMQKVKYRFIPKGW
jgi:protein-S-isoprenylcysteine O-methyltransferase Ste14